MKPDNIKITQRFQTKCEEITLLLQDQNNPEIMCIHETYF